MNGFLNINKPSGWTSHGVVAAIRRMIKATKVGHTGTLDPQATGVLPVCVGKATKLAQFLVNTRKTYRVTMKLGETTDTQDAQGRLIRKVDSRGVCRESVQETLQGMVGEIMQVPPMYSAIKVKGQPLYAMARKGIVIERPARKVTVYAVEFLEMTGDEVMFDVVCSRGTYVRTLCADAGEILQVGAHCSHLERRACGPFRIQEAVTLDTVKTARDQNRLNGLFYGMEEVLGHLPKLTVSQERLPRVCRGVPMTLRDVESLPENLRSGDLCRVTVPGIGLVALARSTSGSPGGPLFKVEKVLIDLEKTEMATIA